MSVDIDPAGCDDSTGGIDFPATLAVDLSDCDDPVALDRDITGRRGATGTVDDLAATDD
jgi:hypothetical protein